MGSKRKAVELDARGKRSTEDKKDKKERKERKAKKSKGKRRKHASSDTGSSSDGAPLIWRLRVPA